MLDRDVQNHLGRRLRAYYAGLPHESRTEPDRTNDGATRLAKAQASLAAASARPVRREA